MTISPEHLPRLCDLARSTDPDDRAQRWEITATLTAGDTCPACGAVLDPEADTEQDPEGAGWFYDAGWYHVCAPGSPAMRAE